MTNIDHATGPLRACNNGKCRCRMLWTDDYPVATVTGGDWGDDFPALEIEGTPGSCTGELKIKAVMRQEAYGNVSQELAAANAAYAVIKEAISDGGDILAAGSRLGEYFGLKSEISKRASQKGNNSEEFWALEKLRQQEEDLKILMIYQGRPGLWQDWLEFQSRQRREREAEELQQRVKVARRKEVVQAILVALLVAVIGLSLIGVVLMAAIASRRM